MNHLSIYTTTNREEAIESLLGLDFEVAGIPVHRDVSSLNLGILPMQRSSRYKSITRIHDGHEYGIVGSGYEIFQPTDFIKAVFAVLDEVETGKWTSWIAGAKFFIDVALSEQQMDVKVGDPVQYVARFGTSLDGSISTFCGIYVWRLVCTNGQMGLRKEWVSRARHTKNSHEKIKFNLGVLIGMIDEIPEMHERFVRLAKVEVGRTKMEKIITQILPAKDEDKITPALETKRSEIMRLAIRGKGNNGKTLWDLYNGVTEYTTHHARTAETETNSGEANRFLSNMSGPNARLVGSALDIIEQYAIAA